MHSTNTPLIPPFGVSLDLEKGLMRDPRNQLIRRASDMTGYYADEDALQKLVKERGNPVHYEVCEVPVPEVYGHLMYCISILHPGLVGEECYMTKGHYHSVPNTGEIYLCLRGTGYMVMKTADGAFAAEPMKRGRMVYVPPFWAHRSVNTGSTEPLVSFCVYPAEAGHNYGDIAAGGFPKRVFLRNDTAVFD